MWLIRTRSISCHFSMTFKVTFCVFWNTWLSTMRTTIRNWSSWLPKTFFIRSSLVLMIWCIKLITRLVHSSRYLFQNIRVEYRRVLFWIYVFFSFNYNLTDLNCTCININLIDWWNVINFDFAFRMIEYGFALFSFALTIITLFIYMLDRLLNNYVSLAILIKAERLWLCLLFVVIVIEPIHQLLSHKRRSKCED